MLICSLEHVTTSCLVFAQGAVRVAWNLKKSAKAAVGRGHTSLFGGPDLGIVRKIKKEVG